MRYPALLQTGNTIGICAPSAGVPAQFTARLDQAKRNIEALISGIYRHRFR